MLVAVFLVARGDRQASAQQTGIPQSTKSRSCAAPEYHQFDFWVGDWDAFEQAAPDKVIARNHVEWILEGCVLREVYEQRDGLVGQSFSIYDAKRKVWHQSWVTNRGQLLVLEGGLQGERMVLTGFDHPTESKRVLLRGTWTRVPDGVRETAETSGDGGKSWKPLFDIDFRPHRR
jgi:hypothetical protein